MAGEDGQAANSRDLALVAGWRPGWDFPLPGADTASLLRSPALAPPASLKADLALLPPFPVSPTLTAGYGEASVFGPLWPGHGLAQGRGLTWGESLTEPLLTRRLAFFLSPHFTPAPLAEARAAAFVAALLAARGEGKAPGIAAGTLVVVTELGLKDRAGGSRRADLWMEWRAPEGGPCFLILEAKLDAPDRPGQLRAYADHLRRHVARSRTARGWSVYLSPEGRTPPRKERGGWLVASWAGLLRRWEAGLARDPIHRGHGDFDSFRADLWEHAAEKD